MNSIQSAGLSRQLCLGQSSIPDSDSGPQTPGPMDAARVHAAYVSSPPPSATSLWRQAASQWQQASSQWDETSKVTPSLRSACMDGSQIDHAATFPLSPHCQEACETPPATQGRPLRCADITPFPAYVNCGGDSVCNAWSPDPVDSLNTSVDVNACTGTLDAGLLVPEIVERGRPHSLGAPEIR